MIRAIKEIERRYRVVEGIVDHAIIVSDRHGIVLGKAEDRRWHVRKDGTRFFANGIMNPLRDEAGAVYAFVKVLRDDTDRKIVEEAGKRAEKALRETEQSFRALFESAPGLYLVLRPDLAIAAASNAYVEATMTTRQTLLGKNVFEVFPDNPADLGATGVSSLRASLETVLTSRQPHTMALLRYDIRRPDGSFEERWWSPINAPVIDDEGRVAYIIHRVEDVTAFVRDRIAGKTGLDDSKALSRMSSELFNRAHESEEANQRLRAAMEQLTESEERLRAAASQLRDSEARFQHLADSMTQLAWIARPDGHVNWYNKRWYDYTGTTFEEMEGWAWKKVHHPDHVERVVAFVKEAWKRPEPWELTFPLRSATGEWRWFLTRAVPVLDGEGKIVQWFGTNTDVNEQKEADLDRIRLIEHLEEERALREAFVNMLTHDLRTPLSVCKMSAHSIASLQLVYGDRFILRAPLEVRGNWDAEALRRVAENLVVNAVKYGDAEQKVTISLHAEGPVAQFSVHNFGNPLSEAERKRVFQQFGRTRSAEESGKAGWGLGLTLVKGIAEAHGGTVEVASDTRGTTFTVSLPLDSGVAAA
jgi:PAS domain S-box-containing protein